MLSGTTHFMQAADKNRSHNKGLQRSLVVGDTCGGMGKCIGSQCTVGDDVQSSISGQKQS